MIDLSIVVVSWNSRHYLEACLSSIPAGAGALSFEVFVVDNASRDGSADFVGQRFPSVRLIANRKNRGFAAANNQALEISGGRYALLLNPDTRVHEVALEKVITFMDGHAEAGACGCLLLNEDGSPQHAARRFPTFGFAFRSKTILGSLGLFRRSYDSVKMRGASFEETMEVDQPSGAALFLRGAALEKVGILDDGYFIFFEEVDLCRRIKDAGYKIYLYPEARITHYGGRSRRQNRAGIIRPQAESLLRYFRKHKSKPWSTLFEIVFRPLFVAGVCAEAAGAALKTAFYWFCRRDDVKAAMKLDVLRSRLTFLRRDAFMFLFGIGKNTI